MSPTGNRARLPLAALLLAARLASDPMSSPLAATYTWDLGDGTRASGPVVRHRYDRPGLYTVTMTATNGVSVGVTARHLLTVGAFYEPVHSH